MVSTSLASSSSLPLSALLMIIEGKHRDLQRVTVPYARLLGVVNGENKDDQVMIEDM